MESGASATSTRPAEPGSGGPVVEMFRLLLRNPELLKVIMTSGLQMAAADIAGTIDLGPDTNQTWGAHTAERVALFQIGADAMAYLTGPMFGRFADMVDRRIVLVVSGFISFLPTFVYWFCFPLDERVVWVNHIASIFAAIGTSTNVAFALSADVTPFHDRALAAGLYYGLTSLIVMLLSVLPSFFTQFCSQFGLGDWLGEHQRVILYYQSALAAAFVASAACIAKPEKRGAEDSDDGNTFAAEDNGSCRFIVIWADMMKLLARDERLRRLSIAALFLSFSDTLSRGIDGQFFSQSLGLFQSEDTLSFDQMNVLQSLGIHLMVLPGFLLAGYLAMKEGTLKLLRQLVPVAAVSVALGGFLALIHQMWFVPVVVVLRSMGDLYQVPLTRMAAGVARPGRVGAWLTLVGMAGSVGSMLGSLVIFFLNSQLVHANHYFPLWIYYPASGGAALLGLVPLLGTPRLVIGWGSAAGTCEQQLEAVMAARKIARIWKKKSQDRKTTVCNTVLDQESESCVTDSACTSEDREIDEVWDCEAGKMSGTAQIASASTRDITEACCHMKVSL